MEDGFACSAVMDLMVVVVVVVVAGSAVAGDEDLGP